MNDYSKILKNKNVELHKFRWINVFFPFKQDLKVIYWTFKKNLEYIYYVCVYVEAYK